MLINFTKNFFIHLFVILLVASCLKTEPSNKGASGVDLKKKYDVLIIGGSHAGLSAAMSLGRLQRSALVVDAGAPRNKVSEHANNFVGMDGVNPDKWRANARKDLEKYKTVDFIKARVTKVEKDKFFNAWLDSGEFFQFRKVILAYGVKDRLTEIKGIEKLWGKSAFHCPYCHGYEVKNKRVGIVNSGPFTEHMVPMMRNLTDKLIFFTQEIEVSVEFLEKMKGKNITVYDSKIESFESDKGALKSVKLTNKNVVEVDALLLGAIPPIQMNSTVGDELGCKKDEIGFIEVDRMGQTSVEGVFAAGDISSMQHSVIGALATGQMAGSGAVFVLSEEDFNAP